MLSSEASNFELISRIDTLPQGNIGSDNGLVLPGNKLLPKPILTEIYGAIWYHSAIMS